MLIPLEISTSNPLLRIGGVVVVILGGVIVTAMIIPIVQGFRNDLKYIEMEIHRTDGREQAHWKRRKKELYLSLIPFYHPRRHRHRDDSKHRHHHHSDRIL